MTIAVEDIKGRLLLELYTHWCNGRFGGYLNPTPSQMHGFDNYLKTTILNDPPSTDPVHQAWESWRPGEREQDEMVAAPEREVLPFEPEPESPRSRSRSSG